MDPSTPNTSNLPDPPIMQPPDQNKPPIDPDKLPEKTFASDTGEKQNAFVRTAKFIFSWIIIPLAIVFLFQALVFQAFYVSGQSMEPTFQDGDYLVISKIGVTSKNIRHFFNKSASVRFARGDVLVFRPPINLQTFYIKRLVGLPGERVVIKDGKITVYNKSQPNGFILKESYTDQAVTTLGDIDITVEPDKVFVLGDNREPSGSYDSRQWGQLPQVDITGRVLIRLLPLNRFRFIGHAQYALMQNPLGNIIELPLAAVMNHQPAAL